MSKLIVYTPAFNAEKTISRAVDSVLKQTYTDFTYYLLDNASTDYTGNIIKEYAKQDNRIIPLHNDRNWCGNWILDVIKNHSDDSYICELDADDEYSPEFLDKMISFIEEYDLQIATCGSDWICKNSGGVIKHDVIDRTLVVEGNGFAEHFPRYRRYMLTIWGTVYSVKLLKKHNYTWYKKAKNFSDTAFCMETHRYAKRAGFIAESLHKYYISQGEISYKYYPDWFQECKFIYSISREFLSDYGEISEENEKFLYVVYMMLIKYVIPRIQNSDANLSQKLKSLQEIFSDVTTQYVLEHWEEVGLYSSKSDFLDQIETWIRIQYNWTEYQQAIVDLAEMLRR